MGCNNLSIEIWEWIRNFIRYFIMDVITYPIHAGIKIYQY